MKVKYEKILSTEKSPEVNKKVIGIGYIINNVNILSINENGIWFNYDWDCECDAPKYWLNEVSDNVDDLLNQIKKLQDFKDYVHKRLDDVGIEKEPNGKHSEAGCRIGDRLDIVLQNTFIVKDDMICPMNKKHCDDECCSVGSICNLSGILHIDGLTNVPNDNIKNALRSMISKFSFDPNIHDSHVQEEINYYKSLIK